jgi:hypothetical protein
MSHIKKITVPTKAIISNIKLGDHYFVNGCSNVDKYNPPVSGNKYYRGLQERNCLTTEKQAEQIRALTQLLLMRDVYNNGWIPDWKNDHQKKHCIYLCENVVCVGVAYLSNSILAFPTEKLRNLFSENFSDLIEEAGDLIC